MIPFLTAGIVLGLSAGFSPGPLLTLVIAQTLRHGVREGAKVALAPLVTDLPIILLCTFVLTRLANFKPVLGAVSLVGGVFVLYLAWEGVRTVSLDTDLPVAAPQSLGKGALVNALSPYPYLFWLTVGAPTILKGWGTGPAAAGAFVAGFLGSLVGAKVIVAVAAGRSRQLLRGRAYGYLMRLLGVLLLAFAALLLKDGLALLGVLR